MIEPEDRAIRAIDEALSELAQARTLHIERAATLAGEAEQIAKTCRPRVSGSAETLPDLIREVFVCIARLDRELCRRRSMLARPSGHSPLGGSDHE